MDLPTASRSLHFKGFWNCRAKNRKHYCHQLRQKNVRSWSAVSLEGQMSLCNCRATVLQPHWKSLKKKRRKRKKRARAIYATITNTIICVLYSACVSKHVFICSNAIHNVISNYSLSRQTRIHCASPMRMELVEVLWLSFCSGEPQTCLKECPSRA